MSEHPRSPESQAVLDMMDVIRAEFDRRWVDTPHNRLIRAVARALALQDGIPEDRLDEVVMGYAHGGGAAVPTVARIGSRGLVSICFPLLPSWAAYAHDAAAAIEVVNNATEPTDEHHV